MDLACDETFYVKNKETGEVRRLLLYVFVLFFASSKILKGSGIHRTNRLVSRLTRKTLLATLFSRVCFLVVQEMNQILFEPSPRLSLISTDHSGEEGKLRAHTPRPVRELLSDGADHRATAYLEGEDVILVVLDSGGELSAANIGSAAPTQSI